ncbi:conserved hypothetical protein [Histoplasma capsulatum G186AR]|uniref:Uncharacterized protein n=2 Tax=Ajellomyces capsulatus TaxID=5037 RepID=C0NFX4_AJECG|nr:uncharacterized protein HCBG_01790 [Histoplasma capsulatum G186AR]EEH10145.1 conserved hypothetical protein [Histoplasma capsulatum G186AR]
MATLVLVTLAHAANLDTIIRLCQSFLMEDATNRFAIGSMVYKLETGVESKISIDNHNNRISSQLRTGHGGLDSVIEIAWRGQHDSTAHMLKCVEKLSARPVEHLFSKAELAA